MSRNKFFIAKCPRCGKFMGIEERSNHRVCPFCGYKVTKKNIVSMERVSAIELKERIKFLNGLYRKEN